MAKPARRTERIEIRVTPAQKRALQQAARRAGRSLSQHIVAAASRGTVAPTVVALSPEDGQTILAALASPPEQNEALRAGFRRYGEMLRSGRLVSEP